jgi:hypothetical protein
MRDNEDVQRVLVETNRQLEQTVADIGLQLEKAKVGLDQAARKMKSLLSVMRMFLEFGDQNRASFLSFLERDYDMKIDRKSLKLQLTHLMDILPTEEVVDFHSTVERVTLFIELGPMWMTTERGRKLSATSIDQIAIELTKQNQSQCRTSYV